MHSSNFKGVGVLGTFLPSRKYSWVRGFNQQMIKTLYLKTRNNFTNTEWC